MREKHAAFLEKIRLAEETKTEERKSKILSNKCSHRLTRQEEIDLQRELEAKFDELFGPVDDEEE